MAEKKVYKLELYRRAMFASGRPDKEFYFVTNPQNYTVVERDRIGIQKTFGGTWAENFGPDDKKITLSGDFGLTQTSLGWDGFDMIQGAKKALIYLRENFMRLAEKAIKDGGKPNDYYLKFKDLTDIETNKDGWIVIVDNFEVIRDKARPFSYSWKISMTAIGKELLQTSLAEMVDPFMEFDITNPTTLTLRVFSKQKGLVKGMSFLGIGGTPTSIGIWDTNSGLLKLIRSIAHVVAEWINVISDMISMINNIPRIIDEIGASIVGSVGDLVLLFEDIGQDIVDFYEVYGKLGNQFMDTRTTADDKINQIGAKGAVILERMGLVQFIVGTSTEKKAQWELTKQNFRAGITMMTNKPENVGGTYLLSTHDNNGTRSVIRVKQTEIVTGMITKTFQEIAEMKGISTQMLSVANPGLKWNERTGYEEIKISRQTNIDEVIAGGNLVYDDNPAGVDIKQDKNGYIVVSSTGSVALTGGFENMEQAVRRRLSTAAGDLTPDNNFGFDVENTLGTISTPQQQQAIESAINEAVLADPRVQSVENLQVYADEKDDPDVFYIKIYIINIEGERMRLDLFRNGRDIAELYR